MGEEMIRDLWRLYIFFTYSSRLNQLQNGVLKIILPYSVAAQTHSE